jgi:hypothetical protein
MAAKGMIFVSLLVHHDCRALFGGVGLFLMKNARQWEKPVSAKDFSTKE